MRITNMRGVNLQVFTFDYDLTWAGFFMNAEQKVYGRFGGRDGAEADAHLTLAGLKNAMRQALSAYRNKPDAQPERPVEPVLRVEEYPAARRLKAGACIHCHQVYDFRRDALRTAGKWTLDRVWVYPSPANVGVTLDPDAGDRVRSVAAGSPAERAGLKAGDVLQTVNGLPVASFADVQNALHQARTEGNLEVSWQRAESRMRGTLHLAKGWKKSDISWRASMWGLEPTPAVHGRDLTPEEKMALGLPPNQLAFRQGSFVTKQARAVGVREDDIIIGLDGQSFPGMSMLQFNAHVRLNYQIGDRITLNVIRGEKRLDLPMVLRPRASF